MVKSFALLSVVAAAAVGLVNGAPIWIPTSEPSNIGRRFPQALAADSPGLKARTTEAGLKARTPEEVPRRFPRRVYHDYYTKRESQEENPHRRHYDVEARSPEPQPGPVWAAALEARDPSPEDLAKAAFEARTMKRSSRRSTTEKDLYKRTLSKDGVKRRSSIEEPTQKRSIREKRAYDEFKAKREPVPEPVPEVKPSPVPAPLKREPEPAPVPAPAPVVEKKLDARALDRLETRDSPVRESRAFIPRAPASHYPAEVARDTYSWNFHTGGDEVNVELDATMVAAICGGQPPVKGGPKKGPKGGPKGHGSSTTTTTGTATTPTDTSTMTGTATSTTATSTGTNTADHAPPGGAQIPPHGGADSSSTPPETSTTPPTGGDGDKKGKGTDGASTKPPAVTNDSHTPATSGNGGHRRDEIPALEGRTASAKFRRIVPPFPKRDKSGSAILYRRDV